MRVEGGRTGGGRGGGWIIGLGIGDRDMKEDLR